MADRAPATEWNAQSYHRLSDPQVRWGSRVLERLDLRGGETVLDAGCGSGRLTGELLEMVPQGEVIAVDLSQNMLDEARRHLEPRFGNRVSFIRSDLLSLSPEVVGRPVDLIFSTATFHWIRDHQRLFEVLFALLESGGWLVAQCGGGPNVARLHDRVRSLMRSEPFAPYFEGWDGPWEFAYPEVTAERLQRAGFQKIETFLEQTPTELADATTYREFLMNVVFLQHVARIPNEGLRYQFIDKLVEQGATDEPPFSLDYWRLNMKGQRPDSEP
jgi:trans-aconitate 2-methyltransferase